MAQPMPFLGGDNAEQMRNIARKARNFQMTPVVGKARDARQVDEDDAFARGVESVLLYLVGDAPAGDELARIIGDALPEIVGH